MQLNYNNFNLLKNVYSKSRKVSCSESIYRLISMQCWKTWYIQTETARGQQLGTTSSSGNALENGCELIIEVIAASSLKWSNLCHKCWCENMRHKFLSQRWVKLQIWKNLFCQFTNMVNKDNFVLSKEVYNST